MIAFQARYMRTYISYHVILKGQYATMEAVQSRIILALVKSLLCTYVCLQEFARYQNQPWRK